MTPTATPFTILLVDDEKEMCLSLSKILMAEGYQTLYTTNPLKTIKILENESIDLVLMDIRMPEMEGVDLLQMVKEKDTSIPVIMMTGYPSVKSAVQSMKFGAINFYIKPPKLPELLKEIEQLVQSRQVKSHTTSHFQHEIVTQNEAMLRILKDLEKAAPTNAAVLVTGESGTGKELAAKTVHSLSRRKNKVFVKVNCAALPEALLESELFGHEKGAYTDAIQRRQGRFELANGGTIFLDEIGDMSLKTQAKILRVVQEQEFERVGGTETIQTDIRLIAATNKDFKKMIEFGEFREDLFYRLSVIQVHLPPLRERKKDVLSLIHLFIQQNNEVYSKSIQGIDPRAEAFLLQHQWPGNVRELKNCVERAVIFCEDDQITVEDLPRQYSEIIEENTLATYDESLDDINKQKIQDALSQSQGVKQKAAQLLNINRRTLYNKMKKLGIE